MKALLKILFLIFAFNISLKAVNEKNLGLLTDIIVIQDDSLSSSELIIQDATGLGYHINTVHPDSVTQDLLNLHRLVILSTGNNEDGCAIYNMRLSLIAFIENGGKVIIEGGDNTYLAFVVHHYPAFASKALKTSGFITHNGGNLVILSAHNTSNLFTSPNFLSDIIRINFVENSDMDICRKVDYAEVFYSTSLYTDKAGIIVSPSVTDPQIINYCFNYAAIEYRSDAKNLLNNSIYNLIGSPVSVTNTSSEVPDDFILRQNYPNPFNPKTVISYQIATSSIVNMKVYDILGNVVATLLNEKQIAGSYNVEFHGNDLSSGVYYYKMSAGDFTATKRMILLK